jgi:hypothetical protein
VCSSHHHHPHHPTTPPPTHPPCAHRPRALSCSHACVVRFVCALAHTHPCGHTLHGLCLRLCAVHCVRLCYDMQRKSALVAMGRLMGGDERDDDDQHDDDALFGLDVQRVRSFDIVQIVEDGASLPARHVVDLDGNGEWRGPALCLWSHSVARFGCALVAPLCAHRRGPAMCSWSWPRSVLMVVAPLCARPHSVLGLNLHSLLALVCVMSQPHRVHDLHMGHLRSSSSASLVRRCSYKPTSFTAPL